MISRRVVLAAAAATAVSGCTPDVLGLSRSVRVAVSWGGPELRAFHRVLDGLGKLEYPVEVVPLGDDISTAFGARSARRPDIVMLPRPGLVPLHRDNLEPMPAELAERGRARLWDELLTRDGTTYGLPFKTAHKSAVWYRPSVFRAAGVEPPKLWSEWLAVNRSLSAGGIRPLALAAGDGWVLTDFLENVLLGTAPAAYRALAVSDQPRPSQLPEFGDALRLLATAWAAPGTLAGGVERSLVQQFPDAVVEVFGHRRAAMVLASDFAEPVIRGFATDPSDVGLFTFPPFRPGTAAPVVVGGDVMVVPRPATDDAWDLVRRLAAPAAVDPWIATGGFIADGRTTGYSPELTRLAEQLVTPGAALQFDLSDRLGSLGDINGVWRVLTDLLIRVGNRGSELVPDAVRSALDELAKVES
ncbi:extracellular solute-binding protein family 1 [Kribbella flavida DSM 17836]|uniref:Extracellular solute-binding protein family 1 n=1 Tax=Kribbella flavida (strain DSM 17836 / JCM 10339 / NBRC 14399) TaxID=479435 RepID=D2PX37_KRIFD|nr:ABC transporter substrate-binding protein [Kribbella flavida]ADB35417.1 extracellular solute-binding protein family 1 [Kribbella flavida DSM 17836]